MRIRPATLVDLPELVALEEACFGAAAWSAALVEGELMGPDRLVLVGKSEAGDGAPGDGVAPDRLVGWACLLLLGDTADLTRVGVAPEHRRRGYGLALVDGLVTSARARGVRRVLLEVAADNHGAIASYVRHGFVTIARREGYYADGVDALVQEARIGEAVEGTPPH